MDQVLDKDIEQSWYSLSLPAQMVNIGNEIKRAFRFTDTNRQNNFLDKAITYIKLTSKDKKNKKVIDEILIGVDVLTKIKNNEETTYTKEQALNYYNTFLHYI